jgi:hypothetical protein
MDALLVLIPIFAVVGIGITAMLIDMKRSYLAAVRRIPHYLSQAEVDDRIAELERQFVA